MKPENLRLINDFLGDFKSEMIDEKWVDFGDGRFKYKISTDGRIMRYWKTRRRWQYHTPSPLSGGYLRVHINYEPIKVHQLVSRMFIPNPENKETINHKNGNKHDNRVDNLEWNTKSENNINAYAIGLKNNKGSANGRSLLTEQQVLEIRKICKTKEDDAIVAKIYGVKEINISNIRLRYTWKHI